MTTAQRILSLAATMKDERGLPAKIAAIVGTTDSYVRTVMRQRKGRSKSDADIRYEESPLGRATARRCHKAWYDRKKADPEHITKRREYQRLYRAKRADENYARVAEERRASYERNREHRLAWQRAYKARKLAENQQGATE